jgi:hypothetical protein
MLDGTKQSDRIRQKSIQLKYMSLEIAIMNLRADAGKSKTMLTCKGVHSGEDTLSTDRSS